MKEGCPEPTSLRQSCGPIQAFRCCGAHELVVQKTLPTCGFHPEWTTVGDKSLELTPQMQTRLFTSRFFFPHYLIFKTER